MCSRKELLGRGLASAQERVRSESCDSLKPGGSLTNRQPPENLWMSGNPIQHYCVPFTGNHNLTKIGQSLLLYGGLYQKYNL